MLPGGAQPPELSVRRARIVTPGGVTSSIDMRDRFSIEIDYDVHEPIRGMVVMGLLRRADGVEVFESSDSDVDEWPDRRLPGSYRTGCSIPGNLLNEGRYTLTIYFLIPDVRFFARIQDALTFDVVDLGARGSEVAAMQERRGVFAPTRLDAVEGNMSRTRTAVPISSHASLSKRYEEPEEYASQQDFMEISKRGRPPPRKLAVITILPFWIKRRRPRRR